MRKFYQHISCLFFFLFPFMMQGQDLPSLPVAPEITVGRLPDGIHIYLVDNKAQRGFADFALVRRGVPDVSLFRFRDVPTSLESVADSTLLMLFDLASSCRDPQAVIVSGDIDPARIRERMELLSIMVPPLEEASYRIEYQWIPRDTVTVDLALNGSDDLAAVSAVFRAQRQSAEMMNTPLPLVTQHYANQLGMILRERLERSFRLAGIPLAGFDFDYRSSADGPGDEQHAITIYTSSRQLDAATSKFASALSALDRDGAGLTEFRDTRNRLVAQARRGAGRKTNAEYLDQCIAAWLYGANLASQETLGDFIANRRLDEERERALFNSFAAALLDSARNLSLHFDIPDRGWQSEALLLAFNRGWQEADPPPASPSHSGDTLSLFQPRKKVRLRAEAAEPTSGGRLWTFSNGIKVIYRRIPGRGEFHYALLLRGGVAEVPGLRAGESAFVGDMLALSGVAGLSGADFRGMLAANGISMDAEASLSDLRITGRAPRTKLPLLMRALLSLSDAREPDPDAFGWYRQSEALRLELEARSTQAVNAWMDSIIHPDYFYTGRKRIENLQDDLPQRAEQYFASLFDKVGDGVFVFLGDLPEDELKKELARTLGDFRVSSLRALRPRVEKRSATGLATRTAGSAPDGESGVHVALSAAVPFNLQNYMAFQVACNILERRLAAALEGQGARAEVSGEWELFPDERISLYINCRPCLADPPVLLDTVRSVMRTLSDTPPEYIKVYKDLLLQQMENKMNDPGALLGDVLTRYSEGKDLVTGYKAAIQAVDAGQVARILGLLADGARVEYLII